MDDSSTELPYAEAVAAARARLASLACTDQTEPTGKPVSCPYARDRRVVELVSGTVWPDRCTRNGCVYCVGLNARRRALAITLVRPVRMIRLSLIANEGDAHPARTALARVKLIRRNLFRMGIEPGEWTLTIEVNPRETGFHAHCLQTGGFILQDDLQTACKRAHAGFPDIRRIKRPSTWVSQYGLKAFGADGYGLKTFRPQGTPELALKLNSGRLEHHSRRFFTVNGQTLRVREAERAAIRSMNGDKDVAFMGVHPSQVDRILTDSGLRFDLIAQIRRERDHANALLEYAER